MNSCCAGTYMQNIHMYIQIIPAFTVNIYKDIHTPIYIFIRPLKAIIRLIKNVYALRLPAFLPILTPDAGATASANKRIHTHKHKHTHTHYTHMHSHTHTHSHRYSQDSRRQSAWQKRATTKPNQTKRERSREREAETNILSLALRCLSTSLPLPATQIPFFFHLRFFFLRYISHNFFTVCVRVRFYLIICCSCCCCCAAAVLVVAVAAAALPLLDYVSATPQSTLLRVQFFSKRHAV